MEKPTVFVDQYREAATRAAGSNVYRGLRIHALPGLHDFVGGLARDHLEPGAALLDLAAGSGAMSLRMQDLGFQVSATDYVPENFRLTTVPFVQADLNGPFSQAFAQSFGAIIASEIIEHLENPRHFARECFKLLAPGGRMVLTTPNLDNPISMASFVRSGSFMWFSDKDYRVEGHITPLTQWQMRKVFAEAGFQIQWMGSFGKGSSLAGKSPRLSLLGKLFSWVSSQDPKLAGEIFVVVLQKPKSSDA